MRGLLSWVLASILTFLVVSMAFLSLARLATDPPEVSLLPGPSDQRPGPALSMEIDDESLTGERADGNQRRIYITVQNDGDELLETVSVLVEASTEDTSGDAPRIYEEETDALLPGVSREIVLDVSLPESEPSRDYPDGPRTILEVRATPQNGASVFRTVILPVSG